MLVTGGVAVGVSVGVGVAVGVGGYYHISLHCDRKEIPIMTAIAKKNVENNRAHHIVILGFS